MTHFKKDIPFNDLPLLPPKVELETKKVLLKTISASRALAKNIITTNDELYKSVVADKKHDNPATKEVLSYKEALWSGLERLESRPLITTNLCIEIVQRIKQNSAGIRVSPGTTLTNTKGDVRYTPPSGENIIREKLAIIGCGRTKLGDKDFRKSMKDAIQEFSKEKDLGKLDKFLSKLFYQPVNPAVTEDFQTLGVRLESLFQQLGIENNNTIFYLSTPPSLYDIIPKGLAFAGLSNEKKGWKRLIIEKPFGYDLKSAEKLNAGLKKNWQEHQIYRIDHYLGKETVQNVLVTRFSNGIFEPLWNRNFIHHVEITSAENFGVGKRGGYYEASGALRDMVQNHLLQLVSLIAMEPPASIDADAIRNEIVKVLQSLRPISKKEAGSVAIRGQYVGSKIKRKYVKGYREEDGVDPASKTETFAALKFYIDNWRWGGVPFYIRTGKHLPTRVTEAVIHFKPTPHYLFAQKGSCGNCNQLIIRIQPDEGMLIRFAMKTPGSGFDLENVSMDFHYSDLSHDRIPGAYERLLLDCMAGDPTLYARIDAVLAAWKFIAPIQSAWKNNPKIPVYGYPAGSWGPDVADRLIEEPEVTWRHPCSALTSDDNYCPL